MWYPKLTGLIGALLLVCATPKFAAAQLLISDAEAKLPQAQEVEQMAEDSYRSGQTGIAALLQSLQTSREIRLQSLQTAQDLQDALSELERAVGAPLP